MTNFPAPEYGIFGTQYFGHGSPIAIDDTHGLLASDDNRPSIPTAVADYVDLYHGRSGNMRTLVAQLTNCPLPVVSVSTAVGFGGVKVATFPVGKLLVARSIGNLAFSVASANQADFTDATPEGDYGLGTVIVADADLGDATDVDLGPSTALTMAAYASPRGVSELAAPAEFDGSSTAKDVCVNLLIDAADIDDDVTTEVLVNGIIMIEYVNLTGDLSLS